MGDHGREIAVDHDKLNQVRSDLDEQCGNVADVRKGLVEPVAAMFGGSDQGTYLHGLVSRGHRAIDTAMTEAEQGLTQLSTAILDAMTELEKADSDNEIEALAIEKMVAATKIMSNPLVLFGKGAIKAV